MSICEQFYLQAFRQIHAPRYLSGHLECHISKITLHLLFQLTVTSGNNNEQYTSPILKSLRQIPDFKFIGTQKAKGFFFREMLSWKTILTITSICLPFHCLFNTFISKMCLRSTVVTRWTGTIRLPFDNCSSSC